MALDVPVPLAEAVPCTAGVLMLQVMVSPSASVPCKVSLKGVEADMVTPMEAPSVLTGALLTAVTVMLTVAGALFSVLSLTLKVKESEPL